MKTKLLFIFLMASLGIQAQVVNIPDGYFKNKLLSSSSSNTTAKDLNGNYFAVDSNSNGSLEKEELEKVTELNISNSNLYSLEGISLFKNLITLDCSLNNIYLVDLQGLDNLQTVKCNNSSIGRISLQYNSNLKNIDCSNNTLQYINLSNLPSLVNVNLSGNNLKGLSFQDGVSNTIQSLNVANNPLLLNICKDISDALPSTGSVSQGFCNSPVIDPAFTARLLSATPSNMIAKNISDQYFKIDSNNDGVLQASELAQIKELNLNADPYNDAGSSINTYGMTNLKKIVYNGEGQYNMGNSTFHEWGTLNEVDLKGSPGLEYIEFNDQPLKRIDVSNLSFLHTLLMNLEVPNGGGNGLITALPTTGMKLKYLNAENCSSLQNIELMYQNALETVNLKNCSALTSFNHNNDNPYYPYFPEPMGYPEYWSLSDVNLENCLALTSVNLSKTKLTHLNVKNCPNLTEIIAFRCQLSTTDNILMDNSPNIKKVIIPGNKITTVDFSKMPSVETLDCSSNLLNTLQNTSDNLKYLSIFNNNLTAFNIHNFPNLEQLAFGNNKFVDLDFSGHHKITDIFTYDYNNYIFNPTILNTNTYLKSLNLNNCTNLGMLLLDSSVLEKLFIKNGKNDLIELETTPSQYICCDDSELSAIQDLLTNSGNTTCSVNTYCNFVPGGNYNTITGTVRFDENNNGCDINDEAFEHMKLKISDGTNTGETFVTNNGKYNLYTQAGNFTVTAEPENASLYTVAPSIFTNNFTDNNNNISTQDICVTKNGNVKDLEVIIAPVIEARPGFDAVYKLIWRNKGNTTLSGNAVLNFDSSKMTFVSSELPSALSGNQVSFSFTNLKPYGNTASEITFNINPPTNPTNPVNNGDILNFTASVSPFAGDVNPSDNEFIYKQTVVGSYDPNDITCLEGNQIPVSMVGKDLHYIVNFENTGTASAVNIAVEMEINPADFDINTLQLQNTSHSTYTKITGNKVEFMIKDSKLAASAHGNIAFKIKTKTDLISGDSVMNKANIYFDYNFPVETNEAVTNIGSTTTLSTVNTIKEKGSINVYPSPTKGDVNITADSKIKSIEVFDAQGRIIQKQIGINSQNTKISIHSSTSGMYIFKIITEKETFMKKVIKN